MKNFKILNELILGCNDELYSKLICLIKCVMFVSDLKF